MTTVNLDNNTSQHFARVANQKGALRKYGKDEGGTFTLSSGRKSKWRFDITKMCDYDGLCAMEQGIADLIGVAGHLGGVHTIIGLPYSGIQLSVLAYKHAIMRGFDKNYICYGYMKKEVMTTKANKHANLEDLVVGGVRPRSWPDSYVEPPIIFVDDVLTTGGTAVQAVKHFYDSKKPRMLAVLLDRQEQVSKKDTRLASEMLEEDHDLRVISLTTPKHFGDLPTEEQK